MPTKKTVKKPAVCGTAAPGAYTGTVIEHFKSPHNYGKMAEPDGIGKVGNLACGDVMWLYIKIAKNSKKQEIIKDIKFETFGCVAAIATSSVITDMAKGKTIEAALKIDKAGIVKELGGLPPIKLHCSVLAADALAEAIYDYYTKTGHEIPKDLEEKHLRIRKDRDVVEEKYKDWTDAEEQIHKG